MTRTDEQTPTAAPAEEDRVPRPPRNLDPTIEATKPTSIWPGWTRAEYTAAGIRNIDAQQHCRRNWIPPTVAGALRANTDLTWDQIETLAKSMPVWLVNMIAQTGWVEQGSLITALIFFHRQHATGTESWIRYGGGNVAECFTLEGLGVSINTVQKWGYAVGVTSPAKALQALLEPRFVTFGLDQTDTDQWLTLAARSTRTAATGTGPATPLDLAADPLVGGRTGLYAAAGVPVTEALEREQHDRIPTLNEIASLVTLAGLHGRSVADARWWADR
jgi:hypothetical protein